MAMRQFKSTQSITDRNTLSVNSYLREVNRYPMITMDEEVRLSRLVRQGGREGEKARKKLIEANLRFVVSVANQYRQKNMDLSDLISEGNIGLIKAAERFDDTKGFKFITFAVWWIRQSIIQAITDRGRMIRIPLNQQSLMQQYKMLLHETMQLEQRTPTAEEFADFASIPLDKAKAVIGSTMNFVSGDTPVGEDGDATIIDLFSSDSHTDSSMDEESLRIDLISVINEELTPREQEIIKRSYGIGMPEQGLEDIGTDMGLSRERVRQIRERAVSKMRHSPNSHLLFRYLG